MKKYKFLILSIFISANIFSQGLSVDWSICYGGTEQDESVSSCKFYDDGFIIAGDCYSEDFDVPANNGMIDFYVARINKYGDTLWTNTFGGSNIDFNTHVTLTNDSCIIISGITLSNDYDITTTFGAYDIFTAKLDSNGNTLWTKSYGGTNMDNIRDVCANNSGGAAIFGYSNSTDNYIPYNYGEYDFALLNIDQNGDTLWVKNYGGTDNDNGRGIIRTDDGGFAIIGFSESIGYDVSNNYGNDDIWFCKLDSVGNIEWEKNYGGSLSDSGLDICQLDNGDFVLACGTYSNDYDVYGYHGDQDFLVIRINSNGDILWTKTYGGTGFDRPKSIIKTHDDNFVVAGSTNSTDGDISNYYGSDDFWIIKLDQSGNLIWEVSLGGSAQDECTNIFETSDNRLIATGYTYSDNELVSGQHGNGDIWVVRFDYILGKENLKAEKEKPFIQTDYSIIFEEKQEFKLYSIKGKAIKTGMDKRINTSTFSSGIYILFLKEMSYEIFVK